MGNTVQKIVGMTLCVAGASGCAVGATYSDPYSYAAQDDSEVAGSEGSAADPPAGTAVDGIPSSWDLPEGASPNPPSQAQEGVIYANSPSELYRLNPTTLELTTVGSFSGCTEFIFDIAISSTGAMYGTSGVSFFKINPADASCTLFMKSLFPNSLTFLPKGVLDPDREALVGYVESTYVQLDPTNGKPTILGELGGGYKASGDIVALDGIGVYATVTGNGCDDCLAQIDPLTGAIVDFIGPMPASNVYGLARWDRVVYGFGEEGSIFTIDINDASIVNRRVKFHPAIPNFWGAAASSF